MQLYNTRTRRKESFAPVRPGKVGMYACGITAYDYCHIGHARSAVVFDVLARYLRHTGLEVIFVRNFTDVDDKIINRANREGTTSQEIAERFIHAFHKDMDRLGVLRATAEPRATDSIQEMIALCETLVKKDNAYSTLSGDVYFRVRSFAGYGKLSGRSVNNLRSGVRIVPGEEKEDPLDFALWKAAKPGEPFWESPWGKGRPGWHIECSAMTARYLSLPLDIHGGGLDLVFPHHENEIAQTETATGKDLARFWVHNGFVQINSEKMSKSLNNFKTIRDILEHHLPETLRLFLLARHYRSPVDFTPEAMEEAEKNLKRLYEALALLDSELQKPTPRGGTLPPEIRQGFDAFIAGWEDAMADDINTAAALGHMNGLLHLVNRILDDKSLRKNAGARETLHAVREKFAVFGGVLGLLQIQPEQFLVELKKRRAMRKSINVHEVERLMEQRRLARKNKDFTASDTLRDSLLSLGVEVHDTPAGSVWDIA